MPTNHPHNWVEVRVLPVSLEKDYDSDLLRVFSSPEAVEVAEDDLSYICYDCKADPKSEAFDEPCPGAVRTTLLEGQ